MRAAGSGGGGAGAGKFPPRPGPAFVVRRGPRAHRGTGVLLLLLRRNVAGEGGEKKGDRLITHPPSSPLYYFQSFSHLPTSWRFRGVAGLAASPSLHPQTGPGFSQPFWGGGLAAEGGGGWGSAPGSSERATKCCPAFRAANNVLS